MADIKYFNFTSFKLAMEITDIDETTYSFLLRSVFRYLTQKYNIDVEATQSFTPDVSSTTSSIVVPLTDNILVGQLVDGEHEVLTVINDETTELTTFTISPAYLATPTTISVQLTLVPFDLQHAIYQHTKFLFESQKRNTSIIDSITDATGNKVSYKTKIPAFISSIYAEYSPNEIAFL